MKLVAKKFGEAMEINEWRNYGWGAVKSCRHCFEGPWDRTNVITTLRQITKICRELRIRENQDGITATRKRGLRCSQPPIGGLTK
jgi:hypothetical protein